MAIYLIEGDAGCRAAAERGAIAVVVDALRTSATIPALLDAGAAEIIAVSGLEHAQRLKAEAPGAILAGAIGGSPIPGFDLGNSPIEVRDAAARIRGRRVIFASTAGSRRLVEAIGAPRIHTGSLVNARPLARHLSRTAAAEKRDIVFIPCGHVEANLETPEDAWAAAYIVSLMDQDVAEESLEAYEKAIEPVVGRRPDALFRETPSARRLERLGLGRDIAAAAAVNVFRSVPVDDGVVDVPGGGHALRLVAAPRAEDDFNF